MNQANDAANEKPVEEKPKEDVEMLSTELTRA